MSQRRRNNGEDSATASCHPCESRKRRGCRCILHLPSPQEVLSDQMLLSSSPHVTNDFFPITSPVSPSLIALQYLLAGGTAPLLRVLLCPFFLFGALLLFVSYRDDCDRFLCLIRGGLFTSMFCWTIHSLTRICDMSGNSLRFSGGSRSYFISNGRG